MRLWIWEAYIRFLSLQRAVVEECRDTGEVADLADRQTKVSATNGDRMAPASLEVAASFATIQVGLLCRRRRVTIPIQNRLQGLLTTQVGSSYI